MSILAGAVASSGTPAPPTAVPVAHLTDSDDYAVAVGTGAAATVSKPVDTAVGDVLVAVVSFQLAHTAGQTVTEGTGTWSIFGPDLVTDGTKRGSTSWALEIRAGSGSGAGWVGISSIPSSWTWTSSAGSQRFTAEIFRVTGADLASGLTSAAAGESALSAFTAGNSGNAIPAFTVADPTLALVVAFGIAQNTLSQAPPVSWTATGYTTHTGSYANTTTGGVSWSAHYIATKTADPDGTEPSVQQVMAPIPNNAQAWAIAIKAPGGGGGPMFGGNFGGNF